MFGFFITTLVSILCYSLEDVLDYKITALFLLFLTGIYALVFRLLPVLILCVYSALLLNYFFTEPRFTFHMYNTDDVFFLCFFLLLMLLNAGLNYRMKRVNQVIKEKETKEQTLLFYNTIFNSLSHELKTPLATILSTAELLQHNYKTLDEAKQKELLEVLTLAGERLSMQVENLLHTSKLETGVIVLTPEWGDFNEWMQERLHHTGVLDAREVNFSANGLLPLLKIDYTLLQHVVDNILYNFLYHTPKDARMTINVTLLKDDALKIVWEDTGPGVSMENLPFLFDKFYRINTKHTGGTGLGLSIVKGFVTALGGEINVRNNNPHGLVFTLLLPVESSYLNQLHHD